MKHRSTNLSVDKKMQHRASAQHCKNQNDFRTPTKLHFHSFIDDRAKLGVESNIRQELKGKNLIMVRKNKQKFNKSTPAVEANMRKTMNYLSNRYEVQEINRSSNVILPQTERQKFIDILQSKILKNQEEQQFRDVDRDAVNKKEEAKMDSSRYNNNPHFISYRMSTVIDRPNEPAEENKDRHQSSVDQKYASKTQRTQRAQSHMPTFRSRSRTLAKEENEIKRYQQSKKPDISRTIQLQPEEQKLKLHKSLIEIEKYQKISLGKDTREAQVDVIKIAQEKEDPSFHPQTSQSKQYQIAQTNSNHINNTETYEKQINVLTKDFFHQWDRMNSNKSKVYKSLRKKIATLFPNLKKHYKEFQESAEFLETYKSKEDIKQQNVDEIMIFNNDQNSEIKTDKLNIIQVTQTFSNHTETKDFQDKMQEFRQRQQLKDIFKQAYFWSRTKNKSMSTNFLNEQEMEKREMVQLKKIQKNLTFMNYMKNKNNKSEILHSQNKIKGANILKNQDSILQIEKEGTKQQQFLKKCLDSAIQNCIKEFQ